MYAETMDRIFIGAYLECALWSTTDDDGEPLDKNYYFDDIAPEAREKMETEAVKFFSDHIDLINRTPEGYSYGHAAHDLWLTRNHHGAGFWDGDAGEVGDELTKLAQELGEQDLYIGDDGKLYV